LFRSAKSRPPPNGIPMLDILYLIGGSAFFVVAALYATACDNL
jgi:hypothetical protein